MSLGHGVRRGIGREEEYKEEEKEKHEFSKEERGKEKLQRRREEGKEGQTRGIG